MTDIEGNIASYLGARRPTDRYTSFDYCFNYFQSHRDQDRVAGLADDASMQVSCLQLGFYLASWGMYRGSTVILQRSLRYLAPIVEVIAHCPPQIWRVDANDYSEGACDLLLDVNGRLRTAFQERATVTLVTKTMLGVFGCVPAFDERFVKGSGLRTFNRRSLDELARFYQLNREVIERHRVKTLDFDTGRPTGRRYSRAKVIDMIFFIAGGGRALLR